MPPKVSVVVTCYNLGRYLDEALASVGAQTLRDFEILVVDDGSNDSDTLATLDRLAASGTRVSHTENRGLPAARNHGVSLTTGDFICCLDADDRLHPTWFELAARCFAGDPELAFVSHWLHAFGDEEWDWTPTDCGFPTLLDHNTVNGAALVRREVWLAVGGQDETLRQGCEDWDFWITLVERGHRGAIVPEVLFDYRRRADSMSRGFDGVMHLALYSDLMARHPATFAAHVPYLWHQRQADLARVRDENARLEYEWRSWLEARRRDREAQAAALEPLQSAVIEADFLRGRLSRAEVELSRAQAGLSQAEAGLSQAEAGLSRVQAALEEEARRVEARTAELTAARQDASDLRASWSWRLTRPLRQIVGALRGEPPSP